MVQECLDSQPDLEQLTHVFLQGGVGGLAAAVIAHLLVRLDRPPRFVVVEPRTANCLQESARVGRPVRVEGSLDTVMAGLACGEPSIVAWSVLESCADAFLTTEDDRVIAPMRHLAHPAHDDPMIVAGESGAASHAALCAVSAVERDRAALNIDESSRILLFGTEGATDLDLYRRLVNQTQESCMNTTRSTPKDGSRAGESLPEDCS